MVIQSRSCGGLGIVAAHLKSQALLLQWVKRFVGASYGWRLFLVYWTQSVSRVSPAEVLASPFCCDIKRLPPFYAALLDAWRAGNGHASADLSHLFIGGPTAQVPVSNITCKSCYDLVLGANRRSPHCEVKFRSFFGTLYWPATWKQVHIMSLDRPVIDLCWLVSHDVLYAPGLGTTSFRTASVVIPWKRCIICFFGVRSPRVVSHGPSLCSSGLRLWHSPWQLAIFFLVSPTMNFSSSRWCLFIC